MIDRVADLAAVGFQPDPWTPCPPTAVSSADVFERKQRSTVAASVHPTFVAKVVARSTASSGGSTSRTQSSLTNITAWNNPTVLGSTISRQVFVAPDDWDARVTLFGFPPNAATFRWTHSSAAFKSRTP